MREEVQRPIRGKSWLTICTVECGQNDNSLGSGTERPELQ